MDFMHLFLSFEGRTRRLHFWIGLIILWVVQTVIWSFSIGGAFSAAALRGDANGFATAFTGVGLVGALLLFVLIWPSLAVQVKRWHDRDKSGWMVLINLIPLVGFIWTLVECGFLDGTQGPNRFGPSPKGIGDPLVAAT